MQQRGFATPPPPIDLENIERRFGSDERSLKKLFLGVAAHKVATPRRL